MGHGSYTSYDWSRLRKSRALDTASSASQIFTRKSMDPRFDPRHIGMREARDSEDHPNSTPIIIGLDVTGSMGYLSQKIAQESLHETMMKLFSTKPVEDPQLLFAAIGDAGVDRAPLQVTQFESDIRIAEQLMELWLEGSGGDAPEDYPLLWYFAARHTSVDCFEKHGKKGYLFTIGDADCHDTITTKGIGKVFSDQIRRDLSAAELAAEAGKMYEIFHIHITKSIDSIPPNLEQAIPGRILKVRRDEISALPEIIVTAMLLHNGQKLERVLGLWSEAARPIVKRAAANLVVSTREGICF